MDKETPEQREEVVKSENPDADLNTVEDIREPVSIDRLPKLSGYFETPELRSLRSEWTAAIISGAEDAQAKAIAYQEAAEVLDSTHLEMFRQGRSLVERWITRDRQPGDPESEHLLSQAEGFGYVETTAMREARARISVLISQAPETSEAEVELEEAEDDYLKLADHEEALYGAKFQVGLLISKATAWRDAGKLDFYLEDLEDALTYADNMGFTDTVSVIDAEIQSLQNES